MSCNAWSQTNTLPLVAAERQLEQAIAIVLDLLDADPRQVVGPSIQRLLDVCGGFSYFGSYIGNYATPGCVVGRASEMPST